MTGAPDYLEPVIGWRVWYAVESRGTSRLSSVFHKTIWPHGAPLVASCRCFQLPLWPFHRTRHTAPAADCRCGIYAATVPTLHRYLPDMLSWSDFVPVVGRVSLWGVVHEHERGWRASLAYPQSLFVPIVELGTARASRIITDLRRYGVPVHAIGASGADAVLDEVSSLAAA